MTTATENEIVMKFYWMLSDQFGINRDKIVKEAGDAFNKEHLAIYPGQKIFLRRFLRWCKAYEVIPIIGPDKSDEGDEEGDEPISEETQNLYDEIDNRMHAYKKECENFCKQIGLETLKNKEGIVHCQVLQSKKGHVAIDNPCEGGHVIGKLAVPLDLIKKCVIIGFIPEES